MDLKLTGKRALVMGSSTGLGRAVAESLIAEGVQVILCSRNKKTLEEVKEKTGAAGLVVADLSHEGEAKRATEEAIKLLGGLDIVVTNTGGPAKGNFLDVTDKQWQTDFQSLWMSVVESLHVALPSMKEQNFGRVLMITSLAAKEPLPGLTTSNGLRAGLEGLCKSLANEYSGNGITFNILRPGYTNTDRLKQLNLSDEKVKEMVPAGRLGEPEELADLATFLSSPKAGYITGQCISIDGGVARGY
jgi:3-oxoacyl-[acyl-carrier protein] reductase